MIQEIVWKMKMKKWKRNCKKYWICVKNNNYFFLVTLKFISLCEFSLTLQNSLQVHILSNYSNFIDTIALLKCIIKRTMLTSTDNFHSVQRFRNNSSSKSIHLTWWITLYFTKFSTSSYSIKLFKFQWYCCITQMHNQENNTDSNR